MTARWGQRPHSPAVCVGMGGKLSSSRHQNTPAAGRKRALSVHLAQPRAGVAPCVAQPQLPARTAAAAQAWADGSIRRPWIQAAALRETKPSGLSLPCQEGHWQRVSTEILRATAARSRGGCSTRCNSLSCLPAGLLPSVLGPSGLRGQRPGRCPGDAAVHPLPMPGTPLRFSSLTLLFASSSNHVP